METWLEEVALVHELTHVRQATAYRGGCWPWIRRVGGDRLFRVRMEFEAQCAAGRFMMRRNRRADQIWARIVESLAAAPYDTVLTPASNCLYEDPPK